MDNTKEYILMCEKATEIQTLRDTERDGDFYLVGEDRFGKYQEYIQCTCHDEFEQYAKESSTPKKVNKNYPRIVWLPRQDQLQEMVGDYLMQLDIVHKYLPTDKPLFKGIQYTSSMEQLWLAFVMKEKYNKVWNGTDWIPVSQRTESM